MTPQERWQRIERGLAGARLSGAIQEWTQTVRRHGSRTRERRWVVIRSDGQRLDCKTAEIERWLALGGWV